jgi:hypothetical protein
MEEGSIVTENRELATLNWDPKSKYLSIFTKMPSRESSPLEGAFSSSASRD